MWPQVHDLERRLAAQATGAPASAVRELEAELGRASRLLEERQARWEAASSDKAARILNLERRLAEVHAACVVFARMQITSSALVLRASASVMQLKVHVERMSRSEAW
jgi:hypothetical protein